MSKSKSKSKSKSQTFPAQYWCRDFEIYLYYNDLFERGKELLTVTVDEPPQDGNTVAKELKTLRAKQDYLNRNFNERERRRREIEWEADNLSHRYQSTLLVSAESYPTTWQLMNTMNEVALLRVMPLKKKYERARPNQVDPCIEPLVTVPGHPSYPSGHATQNFLIAHLLSEVIGDDAELIAQVFAIARRVAENREWAGVHYPSDTEAGEELAREMFPIIKRVLKAPIEEAIVEWQEIKPDGGEAGRELAPETFPITKRVFAAPTQEGVVESQELQLAEHEAGALGEAAATYQGGAATAFEQQGDPFPGTHFREHQWNLENVGQGGGRPGVDINVRGAWEQLKIWQEDGPEGEPVRVALIDLAVDLEHPALRRRLDRGRARNLDYPNIPQFLSDDEAAQLRKLGWTEEDINTKNEEVRKRFVEAFGSFSSAHAVACAGIIAADEKQVRLPDKSTSGRGEAAKEPGCLGIAPHCTIIPYRAMTLTEPVLRKRQILARAVLEAATGRRLVEAPKGNGSEAQGRRGAATWTVGDTDAPAQVLFFPLPLEPLPESEGKPDPLALALAFAATKVPVVTASGNRGTSSVSYLSVPNKDLKDPPKSIEELETLLGLDRNAVLTIFELERGDDQLVSKLIDRIQHEAAPICVGACNSEGRRSRYSQYGDGLTLVAPSDDTLPRPAHGGEAKNAAATDEARPQSIATTDLAGIGGYVQNQSYYTLSDNEFGFGGTSAAAAQVTGVVALMLQANPDLAPMEVRQILCATARVLDGKPGECSEELGYGLVDATRAVEEALRRAESSSDR